MSDINLHNTIKYIPVPKFYTLKAKFIFSFILISIFILLCIPFNQKNNKYIKKMEEYSPEIEAETLYKNEGPRMASEYIDFYKSLPNAKFNEKLNDIKNQAEKQRSNFSYKAEEFGRGLIGMDNHEDYAKITSKVAGYVPYLSDAQAIFKHGKGLYNNWNKFQKNENVNSVELGLDGIGLVASLYGLLPGVGHAADPVKKSTAILRNCMGIMKNEIKSYILHIFSNVFKFIGNSKILDINAKNFNQLSEIVASKKEQFNEAITLTDSALKQIQPIINLSINNWDAASIVLKNASTPEELNDYINIVNKIDKDNKDILKFGGFNALNAAYRLDKEGNFDINIIKNAMIYGDAGLDAIGHIPSKNFLTNPLSSKKSFSTWRIAIICIFGIYIIMSLIKIWFPINKI